MSPVFSLTVIVYALGIAGVCALAAITGRPRPRAVTAGLVILETSVLVQAVLDGVDVLRGRHGGDMATHVGYLLASVAIIPLTVATVRFDPGRWGSAALAVGCIVLAVVSLRLHQTLGAAHV